MSEEVPDSGMEIPQSPCVSSSSGPSVAEEVVSIGFDLRRFCYSTSNLGNLGIKVSSPVSLWLSDLLRAFGPNRDAKFKLCSKTLLSWEFYFWAELSLGPYASVMEASHGLTLVLFEAMRDFFNPTGTYA